MVTILSTGVDRFAADAVNALAHRAGAEGITLSHEAHQMASRPLWAIAHEALRLAGHTFDLYGDKELMAQAAMEMGDATRRQTFFSERENASYIQASSSPAARPGDFPNILSGWPTSFWTRSSWMMSSATSQSLPFCRAA